MADLDDGWDGVLTEDEIANGRTMFGAKIERDPEWDLPAEDGMPAAQVWRIVDDDQP